VRAKLNDNELHNTLALIDTSALYRYKVSLLSHLSDLGFTPTICDFTWREYKHLTGRSSRALLNEIKSAPLTVVYLRTGFKRFKDVKSSLDRLERRAKLAILRVYKELGELSKGSRHKDFCLLTVACLLAERGEVVVVSRDRGIATSCRLLRELGYSIEHYLPRGLEFVSQPIFKNYSKVLNSNYS